MTTLSGLFHTRPTHSCAADREKKREEGGKKRESEGEGKVWTKKETWVVFAIAQQDNHDMPSCHLHNSATQQALSSLSFCAKVT